MKTIKYHELERLAYNTETPDHLASQYQRMLKFLANYIPDEAYRIWAVDMYGHLIMQPDGTLMYSEVEFIGLAK